MGNDNNNDRGIDISKFMDNNSGKNNKNTSRGVNKNYNFPSSTDLSFESSGGIINDNEYEVKSEIENTKEKGR